MANTDNQCKDLDVRDYFTENGYEHSKNSLEDLYSLQAQTQEMYFKKQGRKPFSDFTIGDVVDFLMVVMLHGNLGNQQMQKFVKRD